MFRHIGNAMPSWDQNGGIKHNVDLWVRNYTWIKGKTAGTGGAVIVDVEDPSPILWWGAAGYNGHVFNATYGTWSACGWTFSQLKDLIDEFHYWNVSVILSITGFLKNSDGGWQSNVADWCINTHPELLYVRPDGSIYHTNPTPLAWIKNFTSNDPASGATAGQRVIDVFCSHLTEMCTAGLHWDGIFGSEGWGSVGNWLDGDDTSWIDASPQCINEYGNWTSVALPINWNTLSVADRVHWIMANASIDHAGWGGYMYARYVFKAAHDAFNTTDPFFIGAIFSPDDSWQDGQGAWWGGWSQSVGYNATYLAQYCSGPTYLYFEDQEGNNWGDSATSTNLGWFQNLDKYAAYVAASIKSFSPDFHVINGIELDNGGPNAEWQAKESWMAQAFNYVWINGSRYKTTDNNWIQMQYPDGSVPYPYMTSKYNDFFAWADKMILLTGSGFDPVYMGSTYMTGNRKWSPTRWDFASVNQTFSQWCFPENYVNHPEYLNASMGTLYIPAYWFVYGGGKMTGWQTEVLNSFAAGNLSIVISTGGGWTGSGSLDFGASGSEASALSTFHLIAKATYDTEITVLSPISDEYGNWISAGYNGQTYPFTLPAISGYAGATGYINVANFSTSKTSCVGIYYNATSGRLVYFGHPFGEADLPNQFIPAQIVNNALYWVTNSPINSSEPMVGYKVVERSDGTILIPMTNQRDTGNPSDAGTAISTTLYINTTALGLTYPAQDYTSYWATNPNKLMPLSSSGSVAVTLSGMADVLVIKKA